MVTMDGSDDNQVSSDLVKTFKASIGFLKLAADSGLRTSNADKLRLYGYFKQATCDGPFDLEEPPVSDLIGLTKWKAWKLTSHLSKEAAMRGYIRVVDTIVPDWREKAGVNQSITKPPPLALFMRPETKPDRTGLLYVQKEVGREWKAQFFALCGKILYQYFSSADATPNGLVYLHGCTVNLDPNALGCTSPRGESLYPFILEHGQSGKTYRLSSTTLKEAKEWVDSIRKVLLSHNSNSNSNCTTTSGTPSYHGEQHEEEEEQVRINELIGSYAQLESSLFAEQNSPRHHNNDVNYNNNIKGTRQQLPNQVNQMEEEKDEVDEEKKLAWKEMAARFEFPLEHAFRIGRLVEELVRYTAKVDEYWEPNFEFDGVECFVNRDDTGPKGAALGRAEVDAPGIAILNVFWDMTQRGQIDPMFAKGRTVETFGSQTRIDHLVYKPVWPTTARDFCNLSHWRILQDGKTIVISSQSVIHSRCPPRRGAIRAHIFGSGLVIKQLAVSPPKSLVYYYIQSDPMGNVPTVFIRNVQGRRPMILQQIRSYVEHKFRGLSPILNGDGGAQNENTRASLTYIPNQNSKRRSFSPTTAAKKRASTEVVGPTKSGGMVKQSTQPANRRRLTIPRRMHLSNSLSSQQQQQRVGFVDLPIEHSEADGYVDNRHHQHNKMEDLVGTIFKTVPTTTKPNSEKIIQVEEEVDEDEVHESQALSRRRRFQDQGTMNLGYLELLTLIAALILFVQFNRIPDMIHRMIGSAVIMFIGSQIVLGIVLNRSIRPLRKIWVGIWSAPAPSSVLGNLTIDVTACNKWIHRQRAQLVQQPRQHSINKPVSLMHLVVKTLGIVLAENPDLNGHLLMGQFLPSETADVACMVISGGSRANLVKITNANKVSVQEIANTVWKAKHEQIQGKDSFHNGYVRLLAEVLPVWMIRCLIKLTCFLSCSLGVSVPNIIDGFPFGCASVSNVGDLEIESAFPPTNPDANLPIQVCMGTVKDSPAVVKGEITVRPLLKLSFNIDHRYLDATLGARVANRMKQILHDPDSFFEK